MTSVLDVRAAPAIVWWALAIAALAWPVALGTLIGAIPSIGAFFRGDRSRWFTFWSVTVAVLWIVTVVVVALLARGGITMAMIGARLPRPTVIAGGAATVLALTGLAFAQGARVVAPGPTEHGAIFLPHGQSERLFMTLVIAPSAALCEEIVYRGVVLTLLGSLVGPWTANTVQALLFGFHHGGVKQGILPFLSRAAIGFVFGLIAWRAGGLTLVVAAHYLVDAATAVRPAKTMTLPATASTL